MSIFRFIVCVFFCYFQTPDTLGQQVVNISGTTLKNDHIILEYSIGELAITTLATSGNSNFTTQGLLQPSLKVLQPDCEMVNDVLQYFPNPTRNKLRVVGKNDWISYYVIYAADGKLVARSTFVSNTIDLTGLAAGCYLVQLLPGCNGQYKTFKIIKQN